MGTFKDLTGKRFTRLVALCRVGKIGDAAVWRCRCDCGVERRVAITQLTSGHTKSCGCLRIERFVRQATRHGDYVGDRPTRLNRIWSVMRGCCQSPSKRGNYYQTHGITVCKAWGDYRAFKKWALANGYTDELNLDRIDRRRDFSPLNCHWVAGPAWRYNANRRPVIRSDGKVYTSITEAARDVGVTAPAIHRALSGRAGTAGGGFGWEYGDGPNGKR